MNFGIIGKKREMTQVFDKDGSCIPVTVIDVSDCVFVQKLDDNKVLLGYGRDNKCGKVKTQKYKKLGLEYAPQIVREFSFPEKLDDDGKKVVDLDIEVGTKVNVEGKTKGKGFQGVVRKYSFAGGPKTHGQSDRWRAPGSIGGGTTPGRVYKGKKMPGRMGGNKKTVEGLKVAFVNKEEKLLGVKGAIPGKKGGIVFIVKQNYQ